MPRRIRGLDTPWRLAAAALALATISALGAAAAAPSETPAAAGAPSEAPTSVGPLRVARLESIVHPVAAEHLVEALADADRDGAVALVIELNTPGGLLTSTRTITEAMLAAHTPVIVWVYPDGAQAASAGFFLLMASDFAAMAPATNTGAAHPVGGAGETIEGVLGDKVEHDAAANIRALAARRGRNVEKAEEAVRKSISFTAEEARAAGLVDVVAPDLAALVAALDGRAFEKPQGRQRQLALAGAVVERVELTTFRRLLSTLIHPNLAYLLMTLGMLGLYFELSHPGAILPGVVGGICLLLGLYAMSILPVDFAGVALILLALALFLAEIKVTSYGLLTLGGVVSLVLGSMMLFKSPDPALRASLGLVLPVAAAFAAVAIFLARLAFRAQSRRPVTGRDGLVGARAVARTALVPEGKVFLQGEWWNAVSEAEVAAGAEVEITAVDGLTLHVRPVSHA